MTTLAPPRTLTVTIPWVPDVRCSVNNSQVSERTRVRHRRVGGEEAVYPMRALRFSFDGELPIFSGEVRVDLLVRWPAGRQTQDRDNLLASYKYVADRLEREDIVGNDRDIHWGEIRQERAVGQPETVLILTEIAG